MTLAYIAFMAAIKHTNVDYVVDTLQEYNIGTYIIGLENAEGVHSETEGEHFHFLVEMSPEDYHKFAKRVFIDKFKLRGRATKGKPRQYGKLTKIDNLEKMKAYTVKDSNVRTNLNDEQLEKVKETSFKKIDIVSDAKKTLQYLDTIQLEAWHHEDSNWLNMEVCATNFDTLGKEIVQFTLGNDMSVPTGCAIKSYIKQFIIANKFINNDIKARLLYKIIEVRNPFRY